ncbi:MAG: precorrin-6x reductase [Candidatus Aquicultor secundus]|uniref:precorrin-6A reductase n=4 Tax=Candidatus Aquicultor secundus TaxID=1973895 RepID=UPI0009138428|nr:precorrin-6A reductase [Candidatus Aquicultor secundus]NCO66817.1 precorrin-6A reductase [Solirubrobacter sp.]OIO85472.1 MAG: precorrin-6x reductase [Candidatus Aquicultor secundus]
MILVLGGTTEANRLVQLLIEKNIQAIVSTVYDFAEEFIPKSPLITHRSGKLNCDELQAFIKDNSIKVVVDATHPYALEVSENAHDACEATGATYIRLERGSLAAENAAELGIEVGAGTRMAIHVYHTATHEEAVRKACELGETIFIATGSNNAQVSQQIAQQHNKTMYIRVLPDDVSVNKCLKAGFTEDRIITGIGPFSYEDNLKLWQELGIDVVVTKESGVSGGFTEKLKAAANLGIPVVVMDRPTGASGVSRDIHEVLEDVLRLL